MKTMNHSERLRIAGHLTHAVDIQLIVDFNLLALLCIVGSCRFRNKVAFSFNELWLNHRV